jgi:ketosteroid isomerase-like protein
MSRENAEVARRWIEAINRRDGDAVDQLTHPDFELLQG